MSRRRRSVPFPVLALGVFGACAGQPAEAPGGAASDGRDRRDVEIVHEACDVQGPGVTTHSARGDRPEIFEARSGQGSCRAVDFDRDGRFDTWVYLDGGGSVRRRESDYDRDGRLDEILIYRAGVLAEAHQATTLRGKLDTWSYYEAGRLVRTERDADGDAVVDQWWEYPADADCPLIHSDLDGDGRPDPASTLDYCKETGYVPPERADLRRRTSPDFLRPGETPVEVETKEGADAPAGSGAPAPPPAPAPAGSGAP